LERLQRGGIDSGMGGGGQRAQNNPLYLQSFIDGDDALKFHYIVHSSLDIIEEKGLFFCLMVAV
jgi:hypothetical protein